MRKQTTRVKHKTKNKNLLSRRRKPDKSTLIFKASISSISLTTRKKQQAINLTTLF